MTKLKIITIAFFGLSFCSFSQNSYKTNSGVIYKIGDTLNIGQPLSNLGWISIYEKKEDDYILNKNLINKNVIIKSIDTISSPVNFTFTFFKRDFKIDIDDALKNKEVIPQFERVLAKKGKINKYEVLKTLKELLDDGALTQEEFEIEKKKILNN